MSTTIMFETSQNNILLVYCWNIIPIGGLTSLRSRGFTIFQLRIPKPLLSNSKGEHTRNYKKRRQILPVFK